MTPTRHPGLERYARGDSSFAVGLRPQDAVALPLREALETLTRRYGQAVTIALSPDAVDLERPLAAIPDVVRSPRADEPDSSWLRRTNMVGVNVRTVRDYGGVIKYALTLPAAFDSVQLLPVWEPGVVESLYGIAGWNLNREFFSDGAVPLRTRARHHREAAAGDLEPAARDGQDRGHGRHPPHRPLQ